MTSEFIQRFTNFSFHITISLTQYLCDLIVKNSESMSTNWKKWKMIEKSIKKIMHRMRDKFLRAYIDAKNANSSFSILIKTCQKIRSISMRKDSIFSTLFVLFDRIFALRNRDVIWLHNTFSRNDTIWHQVLVVTNSIRFFEAILIWFQLVSLIVYFTKLYIIVANSLEIHRCSRLTKDTSLKQTHCCNCTVRFFKAVLSRILFFFWLYNTFFRNCIVTFDRIYCFFFSRIYRSITKSRINELSC